MSELLSIIPDDGYTESAYVMEYPRVHGAHRIEFRPMTLTERYVAGQAIGSKSPAESASIMASLLAKKLKAWDVRHPNGGTMPISTESALKLKPNLIERFYHIVSGREGGDQDPSQQPNASQADLELQAMLEDRAPADLKEEGDIKN